MANIRLTIRLALISTIVLLIYLITNLIHASFKFEKNILAINEDTSNSENHQLKTLLEQQNSINQDLNNISPNSKSSSLSDALSQNSANANSQQQEIENYKKSSNFISDEKLAELRKNWDEQLEIVKPVSTGFPCEMSKTCPAKTHYGFRIRSGAASVIGPWVCVDGIDIMRSVLNNVDRGMNIALIDGSTGRAITHKVFDLYGQDDSKLIQFLKEEVINRENSIILATSYDDAAIWQG